MYDFFNILAGIFFIGTIASIVYIIIKAVKKRFGKKLLLIPLVLFLIYLLICAVMPEKPADPEPEQTVSTTESVTTAAETTEAPTTEQPAVNTETGSSAVKSGTYELSNGMTLFFSDSVRNDTTGNWRITTMADPSAIGDYAVEYYEKLFSNDDEIHAIVNFTLKTTTKITKQGDSLDVTVYEYVSKEEHDAKLLFSGTKLSENAVKLSSDEKSDENTEETPADVSNDAFIKDVESAIDGQLGQGETYKDVTFKDGDLCVSVDFSNADPAPLTMEDLALSRTSSITDAILGLDQYDSLWNTITVDFGDVGKIINKKENMESNGYGRYFPSEKFTLTK
ncbi:MAG: hypothetical protein PUG60_10375 [Lachnospiraceae bacterium]|nr:hypothetical protein [Lachnospiraceae bacterium]